MNGGILNRRWTCGYCAVGANFNCSKELKEGKSVAWIALGWLDKVSSLAWRGVRQCRCQCDDNQIVGICFDSF